MKRELHAAINIYTIIDNELNRMHTLLQAYMSLPKETSSSRYNSGSSMQQMSDLATIYKRIVDMQNILINSFKEHDKMIQEKVAELALTGNSDDK